MGARGPLPSENPKRRNKESKPNVVGGDPPAEVPALPECYWLEVDECDGVGKDRVCWKTNQRQEFGDRAVEAWDRVWSSPLASEFRPETREALLRWVVYVDRFWRLGHHHVEKDLLQLEKQFALTWEAQKRNRLKFEDPRPETSADVDSRRSSGGSRARGLRVVG